MDAKFAALIPVVFAIVEALVKLGVKRNIAHLCALAIGVLVSFLVIDGKTITENIIYGLLIGLGSIGTCDTVCKNVDIIKEKKSARKQRQNKNNDKQH